MTKPKLLLLFLLIVIPSSLCIGDECTTGCTDDHKTVSDCINGGEAKKEQETCSSQSHESHNHGSSVFAMTLAQRKVKKCEHNMAAFDCRECSNAVGVVHVSKDLLKKQSSGEAMVVLGQAQTITVDDRVDTFGHIALDEERAAHVSPRVSGTIKEVHLEMGENVKEGDALFDICSIDVGRAVADYLKAKALLRLSKRELDRSKQMLKQRVTSEKEVFRRENEFEQAQIEHDSAQRQLLILGVTKPEIKGIEKNERLLQGIVTVRSPIEGTIVEKHAVIGEVIQPGTNVMLIADLALVWVWAQVYDRDAGFVLEHGREGGKEAQVTIDAFKNRKFSGVLDYVSPIVDKDVRTVKMRVILDNEERLLLPGMFCRVSLPLHKHQIVAVPRHSVLNDGETNFVFVPAGEGKFMAQKVQIGIAHGDHIPINHGLKSGETLVTKGTFMLKSEVLKERMGAG